MQLTVPRSVAVQFRVSKYDRYKRPPVRIGYYANEAAKYLLRQREAAGKFSSIYAVAASDFQEDVGGVQGYITHSPVKVIKEVAVSFWVALG